MPSRPQTMKSAISTASVNEAWAISRSGHGRICPANKWAWLATASPAIKMVWPSWGRSRPQHPGVTPTDGNRSMFGAGPSSEGTICSRAVRWRARDSACSSSPCSTAASRSDSARSRAASNSGGNASHVALGNASSPRAWSASTDVRKPVVRDQAFARFVRADARPWRRVAILDSPR